MSSLGSDPPVEDPFDELLPDAPPDTRSFSAPNLHPISKKPNSRKIRLSFFIFSPSPRLSADLFSTLRKPGLRNGIANDDFRLFAQTAEIHCDRSPRRDSSARQTGNPAADEQRPAAGPESDKARFPLRAP